MRVNYNEFKEIRIFKDGKIIFAADNQKLRKIGNLKDIISYDFPVERIRNARKENLMKKDIYFLSVDSEYYLSPKKIALYVHSDYISVKNLGEFVAFEHDGEKDYKEKFELNFHNVVLAIREVNCKKMLVDKNWKIPEDEIKNGAHWSKHLGDHDNSYDVVDLKESQKKLMAARGIDTNYNLVHWTVSQYEAKNYVAEYDSQKYTRIEKDEGREQREKLAQLINECLGSSSHLSHYDIARLQEKFNITVKEGVKNE